VGADKRYPDAFSKALAGYEPVSPRHAAILKSWRDHSNKGEQVQLWRSLERAAEKYAEEHGRPVPQPADFVGIVLGCAMPASRLNDHNEHVLKLFGKLKREIIEVVKDADHPLDLWRDLQRFEETLWHLEKSDYPTKEAAGGRNDVNDSRDRKLFAQHMFRYLKDSCGEYLAEDVTVMLNIIFPTDKGTDERTARDWLSEISLKSNV
jgi:hypothetical protein